MVSLNVSFAHPPDDFETIKNELYRAAYVHEYSTRHHFTLSSAAKIIPLYFQVGCPKYEYVGAVN